MTLAPDRQILLRKCPIPGNGSISNSSIKVRSEFRPSLVEAYNSNNFRISQFHQHFMSSFCAKILLAKNYEPKL